MNSLQLAEIETSPGTRSHLLELDALPRCGLHETTEKDQLDRAVISDIEAREIYFAFSKPLSDSKRTERTPRANQVSKPLSDSKRTERTPKANQA